MISRTKFQITAKQIKHLFAVAGLVPVTAIAPLGAGEFNAVFSVQAAGRACVLKIAPAQNTAVMTYEKNMMKSEVYWYEQIRRNTGITVPNVYYADFSNRHIPAAWFIMEKLPGLPLNKMELSEAEQRDAEAQKAKMAAQLHRIRGEGFGYLQNGLHNTWYQAIRGMVQACVQDCAAKGHATRQGSRLLAAVERYRAMLEQAECCMVNFDIWSANIICTRKEDGVHYAWIDPERSFWGDRIADFVCFDMLAALPDKHGALAAYNAAAKVSVMATREETIRCAVAQGYLALLMETEKYYRYSLLHFGWWRNVLVCRALYKSAFGVLESTC